MQGLHLTWWNGKRAVVIRTTDRITFKQCRRKWNWASHLKNNLGPLYLPGPLWFGSAIHYALEDYHGYNVFNHPRLAFQAYCIATAKNWRRELPSDAQDLWHLGNSMMDYYVDNWLPYKTNDDTYWEADPHTGEMIPQVEVNFEIPLYPHECNEIVQRHCAAHGIEVILYRGTFDRIAEDEHGRLWIVEYKTAKRAEHLHYQTDPQITTYCWAATHVYDKPIAGVVYVQFVKTEAMAPKPLQSGRLSVAKNQVTSGVMYKRSLERLYGEVRKAPKDNVDYLAYLYSNETANRDRYIQRVPVDRNVIQGETEAQKILLELEDMLNPDLPLYPNPTRDCSRMCSFLSTCVSFDDGSDWAYELKESFGSRDEAGERLWRMRLPPPQQLIEAHQEGEVPDLEGIQANALQYKLAEIESGEMEYEPEVTGVNTEEFDMNAVSIY
jgi:hypothetical protein